MLLHAHTRSDRSTHPSLSPPTHNVIQPRPSSSSSSAPRAWPRWSLPPPPLRASSCSSKRSRYGADGINEWEGLVHAQPRRQGGSRLVDWLIHRPNTCKTSRPMHSTTPLHFTPLHSTIPSLHPSIPPSIYSTTPFHPLHFIHPSIHPSIHPLPASSIRAPTPWVPRGSGSSRTGRSTRGSPWPSPTRPSRASRYVDTCVSTCLSDVPVLPVSWKRGLCVRPLRLTPCRTEKNAPQHEKTLILQEPMKHYGVASVFNQPVANGVRV